MEGQKEAIHFVWKSETFWMDLGFRYSCDCDSLMIALTKKKQGLHDMMAMLLKEQNKIKEGQS